jgi:hypothetical protein
MRSGIARKPQPRSKIVAGQVKILAGHVLNSADRGSRANRNSLLPIAFHQQKLADR